LESAALKTACHRASPHFRLALLPQIGFFQRFNNFLTHSAMSRICFVTGKGPVRGHIVFRRGVAKKAGGIGTSLTKRTKRKFRPNLQRIRVKLPGGQIKRVWVSVKAIKAGLVQKV
jgi:large subunit ribosomal protein L28